MTLKLVKNNVPAFLKTIGDLTRYQVVVGVPSTSAGRQGGPITNAALAYIHNYGAPEANIPPRPFLEPGIKEAQPKLVEGLKKAAKAAVDGNVNDAKSELHKVGLIAQASIRRKITEGIPPPLAYSTVLGRIRRRQSKTWRKKKRAAVLANVTAGAAPGEGLFTPLIDTGQLRNSISYVVRRN